MGFAYVVETAGAAAKLCVGLGNLVYEKFLPDSWGMQKFASMHSSQGEGGMVLAEDNCHSNKSALSHPTSCADFASPLEGETKPTTGIPTRSRAAGPPAKAAFDRKAWIRTQIKLSSVSAEEVPKRQGNNDTTCSCVGVAVLAPEGDS